MSEFSVKVLGSVSPYSKGTCNGPGFLVQNSDKKILFDCGSGVSRQLHFPEDLKSLIVIISHLHLDHYSDLSSIGYASFVYKRLGLFNEEIKVFHPPYGTSTLPDSIIDCCYLDSREYATLTYDSEMTYVNMKISWIKNNHCLHSYSFKVECQDKVLIYTGDTPYNDSLVEFCKNADLLICEASFLKSQDCTPGHMYASEAGMLAKNAKVKKLMLTHFWPEIDKRLYLEEAKQYFLNTIVAEEGQKLILRR